MASIAKLAIQITTDTGKMVLGFRDAQARIKAMKAEAASSAKSMSDDFGSVVGRFFTLEKVISAARRELTFFFRTAADFQDKLAELTDTDRAETWRGQWERFTDNLGNVLTPHLNTATKLFRELLDQADRLRTGVFGLESLDHERLRLQALADIQKRFADDQKKAAAESARALEALKNKAESLKDSLRTPFEVMVDSFTELRQLQAAGLLDVTSFSRRADQIAKSFKAAQKSVSEMKLNQRVGAVERGTSAEVSARLAGIDALTSAVREQTAVQKRNLSVNEQILKAIDKSGVRLNKGAF